ncbi:hypothetical protein DFH07DRAFT_942678 [Mycena maculata]|uniref:Uncharacterized protein n=1 Tax=Mycena maculata TaxID=230809 RepID=A0AAD7N6J5_9AGAR|nr:hypothetical protein DFH07DRAFT_942678 [Mycena maculata]
MSGTPPTPGVQLAGDATDGSIPQGAGLWNSEDLDDLRHVCRKYLRPYHPTISYEECDSVLETDESLYEELKECVKNDHPGDFPRKAWAIYQNLKTAGNLPRLSGSAFRTIPEPPPDDPAIVMDRVKNIIMALRPVFEHFVAKEDPLETWLPPESDPDFMWFKEQKFPSSERAPDLLLHKLGSFWSDKKLRKHLDPIFPPNPTGHTFLVNTSGSGKTRSMLEGLCLHWGFYFASIVDSNQIGSHDVQNAIQFTIPNSPGFAADLTTLHFNERRLSLEQNRDIARKRFSEILLARIIIFQLFLEVIAERTVAEPKKLWLLLQLHPRRLGYSGGDFFEALTAALQNSPENWIKKQGDQRFEAIRTRWNLQGYNDPAFFLVLDEAQYAARRHFSAFRSDANDWIPRPILREIITAWVLSLFAALGLWMVISGTGVDSDVIAQIMASRVAKPGDPLITNVGAFTNHETHVAFIKQYIPPRILKTTSGDALVERMSYWLRGRHRFTTAFLSELLAQRFRSPHKLLNAFVKSYTGVTPTDGQHWIAQEPEDAQWPQTLQVQSFDFHQLHRKPLMLAKIKEIINSSLIRSDLKTHVTVEEKLFVEYGFARYAESRKNSIVIDEPLVLCAASTATIANSTGTSDSVAGSSSFYSNRIHHTTTKCNGLEDYLAFTLPYVFENKPCLDQVFDFYGSIPSWSSHRAELVSIHAGEVSSVLPMARPCFSYGINADNAQTVEWLQHRGPGTFICFPPNGMGPDLIFALRVLDGSLQPPLLWVAVQVKYSETGPCLDAKTLRKAIRSVTPSMFWINKHGAQHAPVSHPRLVEDTLDALENLPNRMATEAGTYSLLRVVAAFPVPAGLERVAKWKNSGHYKEAGKHPIASLNREFLATTTDNLEPKGKIASMMAHFQPSSTMDLDGEPEPPTSGTKDKDEIKKTRPGEE